jgi:hypothetical protein
VERRCESSESTKVDTHAESASTTVVAACSDTAASEENVGWRRGVNREYKQG